MRYVVLVCSLLFLMPAFAELAFEKSVFDIEAKADDREASVEYVFTNKSNNSVTIRDIKTGCDCTIATIDKKTFQSGESGRVKAVFKFGDRVGEQRKIITVQTDDPDHPESLLGLNVTIPQMWIVSPRFLSWRQGQPGESQIVQIKVSGEKPQKLIAAEVLEGAVKVELHEEDAGKYYTLIVKPVDVGKPTRAMILIRSEDKTLPLVPVIYASVIGGAPPPTQPEK